MKRYLTSCLTLMLLVGCIPSAPPAPEPLEAKPASVVPDTQDRVQARLAELPGAEPFEVAGQPAVRYAVGVLFAREAVLPLPGGARLLEPLVAILKEFPEERWLLEVAAESGHGSDYDRRLAAQRLVMIQRYLQRSGLKLEKIEFKISDPGHAPLRVVHRGSSQDVSSEVGNE